MVNPVWVGTLMFGEVPIGVRLYSARERRGPVLHQFERGTADRIRYVRVNERTGEEVPAEKIVRGARTALEDEYVVLEPEELEALLPHGSRTMRIEGFVSEGSVGPLWYASTYYMAPRDPADARPYRLLHSALDRSRRAGTATVVLRDRESPVLIEPTRGVLAASTLWWPDEVRAPDDVMPPVPYTALGREELALASELVASLSADWDPARYEDSYGRRLTELVRAKAEEETIVHRPGEPERPHRAGDAADGALQEALRRSLPHGRAPGPRQPSRGQGRRTKRELLRRASELEVPGRSKMNREELEEAVARAGGR
ncbi:DNA end-binding protein Ku [Nocardiopsis flavescens]|uniref:Non-homologous end joining protein Ku n=1 Tax=Nocardiopsis flavescens TaxID=758803 RepID=A0A1M6BGM6_9ACTN|nr:Ku protein [Nocardiopsis flavescens]SHI47836.1 DNA end-binding protein Ku [Nocardiopsis flavescens]